MRIPSLLDRSPFTFIKSTHPDCQQDKDRKIRGHLFAPQVPRTTLRHHRREWTFDRGDTLRELWKFLVTIFVLLGLLMLSTPQSEAAKSRSKKIHRKPASVSASLGSAGAVSSPGSIGGVKKPLQVTGQTRNLNMMLVLKNGKEQINFVNQREHFKKEIVRTQF